MSDLPVWIRRDVVRALHERQLAEHGGAPDIRDEGLLDSALNAPKHLFHYESAGICTLGAAYGFNLMKNHPFIDGNKRTAYVCMRLFLVLNGCDIEANRKEKIKVILKLAAGKMNREGLSSWIQEHLV